MLEEKFLDDILVFENEPLLLDIFLSLFLVDSELNFLFESTDLSLMFIFEEGEIGFGFGVMVFFPFIELLFLEFIGFALDLVGFHIVLLSCKLLLDFSEVEELWALLEVFGFLAVDLFLNGELRMWKELRFVVNVCDWVIVAFVRFANAVGSVSYPTRY